MNNQSNLQKKIFLWSIIVFSSNYNYMLLQVDPETTNRSCGLRVKVPLAYLFTTHCEGISSTTAELQAVLLKLETYSQAKVFLNIFAGNYINIKQ